ncbi:hypothetical protein GCM10010512_00570 [Streptomyces thermoviolaceus subsp. thermoviolaceus]|nr:hypothetical protein GCM10010499_44100 [Streptomyces thermoviolaceus subsp. apingens]GHA74314.1 hypothetical protein GCM10010512_00570 [Streptomyces thermoviolaceus subsp. thermoviolaceus]
MLLLPLAGGLLTVANAAAEGNSVDLTLHLCSSISLMFVIMLVPVAKKVAADIEEQERKPWTKVPLTSFSLCWMATTAAVCVAGTACGWPFVERHAVPRDVVGRRAVHPQVVERATAGDLRTLFTHRVERQGKP